MLVDCLSIPRNWYAVLTRSRAEKPVAAELVSRGIECYLPLAKEVHAWSDRQQIVEAPLFPGYHFVRISNDTRERLSVLQAGSVARILGQGNQIEPVSDIEIDSIRQIIASGLSFERTSAWRAGEHVRVRRGPLRGVEGYFERLGKRGRLILNVELLARALRVEIDASDVQPARRTSASRRNVA